ncbi:MAG: putative signal transduction histidine kinase [Frankiales bacterium]|nr:putative signal transduction histidine kinase [Frankiales bacterium]
MSGALRGPFALLRFTLLAVCALLAGVKPQHVEALPVIAGLAAGTLVTYRWPRLEVGFPYLGALVAAVSIPVTGGGRSPLLPYLLSPGLILGFTRGVRGPLLAGGLASGVLMSALLVPDLSLGPQYQIVVAEWVVLMMALGLVASWARRLAGTVGDPPDLFSEARHLLEQVHALTRQLPGGLDAPATADALLVRCCDGLPRAKAALLSCTSEGSFVPIAVQGTRRVPWRAPLEHAGPLRTAWTSRELVIDVREPDSHGRRTGSVLLALPLASSGDPFGLLVVECADVTEFPPGAVDRILSEVQATSSQLEAALLFEEVRLLASLEERDRLAREMHDGIAQELAFLGYRLDELRGQAAKVSPELAELALAVREDLTTLISELRLSITELRTSVRADRGLGAVLTSYLQSMSAGRNLLLNVSLHETAFRLPGDHEVALLQAAQVFAQEVRRSPDVTVLTVRLEVDPPSARLSLTCDGTPFRIQLGQSGETLAKIGASVTASELESGEYRLEVVLRGGTDEDQRPPSRRPRPDQARPPSSVRAD